MYKADFFRHHSLISYLYKNQLSAIFPPVQNAVGVEIQDGRQGLYNKKLTAHNSIYVKEEKN